MIAMWPEDGRASLLRGPEGPAERWGYAAAATAVTLLFWIVVASFNVEAHPGVDQNGYLVGGKVLAFEGAAGLRHLDPATGQPDPFGFVGRMWIGADLGTPQERFYPKYPPGLPFLVAITWWLGRPELTYWINPVCMTLGVAGSFVIARMIAGSALGLLAMIVVASSPAILGLATNPNSHAGAVCFVTWGMAMAMLWSRWGGWWRALLAGLCLGAAVTFRYTEGLLIVPAGLLVVFSVVESFMRTGTGSPARTRLGGGAVMAAGWLAVVGAMVSYNLASFGSITGYDPTRESTGFRWAYFHDNWLTMLRALDDFGLSLVFPLGVAGMIMLAGMRVRVGLVMSSWIVPGLLIYAAYYWAPSPDGLGYTRFFVTQFPAIAACAAAAGAAALSASSAVAPIARGWRKWTGSGPQVGWALAGGAVVALAVLVGSSTARRQLANDQLQRLALADRARVILDHAPPGSVIVSRDSGLMHHLQFVGDYRLLDAQLFDHRTVQRLDDDLSEEEELLEPEAFDPQRKAALFARLGGLDQRALTAEQQRLVSQAIERGERVFVAMPWRPLRGRDAEQYGLWRVLPREQYETRPAGQWDRMAVGDLVEERGGRRVPRWGAAGARRTFRPGSDRGLLVEVLARTPVGEAEAVESVKADRADAEPGA